MATDIRVIFRPDGVDDIIDGLRTIRREAIQAERAAAGIGFGGIQAGQSFVDLFSKKAPDAAGKFTSALGTAAAFATRLIPVLGLVGASAGILSLGRNSIQSAQDVSKLREQFALTSAEIQTLQFAARKSEATNEDLDRGLNFLAKSQRELRAGADDVVAAYADLNLTAKDFEGLNLAQTLELIGKRMDGIDPTKLNLDKILGRDARKLIPTLNELAEKGLAGVANEGEKVGAVLGGEATDATKRLGDELQKTGERAQGFSNKFVGFIAPAVTAVLKRLGELSDRAGQLFSGDIFGALAGEVDSFLRFVGIRQGQLAPGKKPGGGTPAIDDAERRKTIEISRKQSEEQFKLLAEENRRRKELAEASIEGERQVTEARVAGSRNQIEASRQVFDAEAKALRERVQLAGDTAQAEEDIAKARYDAEIQLARQASATTAGFEARRVEIDRQFAQERGRIAAAYYSELRRLEADALAQFKASKEAQKAIEDEIRNIRKSAADLAFDSKINGAGPLTQLSEREARAQQQIKELKEAVGKGDIERARQLRTEIEAQARAISAIDSVFAGDTAERILNEANAAFEPILQKQKQLEAQREESARKTLENVRAQIKDVETLIQNLQTPVQIKISIGDDELRALTARIQEQLSRTPFQIAVNPVVAGGGAPAFAEGGRVAGTAPHARADNVLARVTPGEFIHKVAAVRKYGMPFMRSVNNLSYPRFADGGLVGSGGAAGSPAGEHSQLSITINGRRLGSVFGPREAVEGIKEAFRTLEG